MESDEYLEHKAELDAAIKKYYAAVEPEAYINAWTLVTHKMSPEMQHEGGSAVGVLNANDQPFPMTRGMLETAAETA